MEKFLKDMFDFHRYQPNTKLSRLIEETRDRYGAVSDDELELVNAAGDIYADAARRQEENE
ncbi:MAG: hypothetical protein IJ466_04575 [Clostridia bacterium]|nr:hypothetical protein [Clostridia bacterium]